MTSDWELLFVRLLLTEALWLVVFEDTPDAVLDGRPLVGTDLGERLYTCSTPGVLGALGTELMGVNGWICVVGAPEEALPGNDTTTALVGALVIPLAAPGEAPASCQGLQVKDPEDQAARGSGD